ncbi:neutral zinc metallopeptidase [Kribbella sp. NBC_00709]|uniref:neutral zinc metallopeptidase n=1 Tax=Kribbella sp. NBC_00709 TaxID=2975972 RepID=UPI002E2E7648|nr:neutral zinc metallopeptidase [Kribbella sp. NBC_00709]
MHRGVVAALLGLAVAVSAGCAPSRAPAAGSTISAAVPSVTPSPTPSPTPTPKPSRVPTAPKTVRVPPKAPEATPTYRSLEKTYLVRNKIYSTGQVPAVPCELPQIALTTRREVQLYASAVLGCLQRAWKPVVERSDVVFSSANVYAVNAGSKTRCGILTKEVGGFYCSAGSGIYLDWRQFVEEDAYDRVWAGVYLQFTMAHEFGHHVQELVGISSYFEDRWDRTTGAAQLEQMRRHELQASCFASAFIGANQQTLHLYDEDRLQDYEDAAYSGDDDPPAVKPEHGSRKSSTAWAEAAFKAKSPSACNTWSVPPSKVT